MLGAATVKSELGRGLNSQNLSGEEFERDFKLKDTNWFYKGMFEIWASFLDSVLKVHGIKGRALDIGCGAGGKMPYLKNFADDVLGLDLSLNAIKFCKNTGFRYLSQGAIEKLPYKSGVFSLVNIFDVLEHIEDDDAALVEINRIMADKGFLAIALPAFNILWSQHDIANFHKRRYDSAGLANKLKQAGFAVKRMSYANFFLFPPVLVFRLIQYRILRHVSEAKRTRVENIPGFVNSILGAILKLESIMIKKVDFPFGVALLCVAQKART